MTRCRAGDLAVLVRSTCGNEGAIVEVVRFVGEYQFLDVGSRPNVWLCKEVTLMKGARGCDTPDGHRHVPDSCLRPLRDPGDDAVDQTLSWKRAPNTSPEEIASFFLRNVPNKQES